MNLWIISHGRQEYSIKLLLVCLVYSIFVFNNKLNFISFSKSPIISPSNNSPPTSKLYQENNDRKLRRFGEGEGGLVVFYHVAKTGGSTIRGLFKNLSKQSPPHFKYKRYLNPQYRDMQATINHSAVNGNAKTMDIHTSVNSTAAVLTPYLNTCVPNGKDKHGMEKMHHSIIQMLSNNSTRTLLLEIHGGSPGLDTIASYIQQWREVSLLHNRPFFAFTLVRKPISHATSYLKFFHVKCKSFFCEHDQYENATEDSLLVSVQTHPNMQCFLLKHMSSIAGMHPSFYTKCQVTEDDCKNTYKLMKQNFDWIGTTEKLSLDTIPLLSHILQYNGNGSTDADGNKGVVENEAKLKNNIIVKNFKVSKKLSFEENLNITTTSKLLNLSSLDQAIYDQVSTDYSLPTFFMK